MSKNHNKHIPICPHCRYDLSGHRAIAPVDDDGLTLYDCPECGRSFKWPRVGRPKPHANQATWNFVGLLVVVVCVASFLAFYIALFV